jgi:hypothetical protein
MGESMSNVQIKRFAGIALGANDRFGRLRIAVQCGALQRSAMHPPLARVRSG